MWAGGGDPRWSRNGDRGLPPRLCKGREDLDADANQKILELKLSALFLVIMNNAQTFKHVVKNNILTFIMLKSKYTLIIKSHMSLLWKLYFIYTKIDLLSTF